MGRLLSKKKNENKEEEEEEKEVKQEDEELDIKLETKKSETKEIKPNLLQEQIKMATIKILKRKKTFSKIFKPKQTVIIDKSETINEPFFECCMLCWVRQVSTKIRTAFQISIEDQQNLVLRQRYKILYLEFEGILQQLTFQQCCKLQQRSKWFKQSEQVLPMLEALNIFIKNEISRKDNLINRFIKLFAEKFIKYYGHYPLSVTKKKQPKGSFFSNVTTISYCDRSNTKPIWLKAIEFYKIVEDILTFIVGHMFKDLLIDQISTYIFCYIDEKQLLEKYGIFLNQKTLRIEYSEKLYMQIQNCFVRSLLQDIIYHSKETNIQQIWIGCERISFEVQQKQIKRLRDKMNKVKNQSFQQMAKQFQIDQRFIPKRRKPHIQATFCITNSYGDAWLNLKNEQYPYEKTVKQIIQIRKAMSPIEKLQQIMELNEVMIEQFFTYAESNKISLEETQSLINDDLYTAILSYCILKSLQALLLQDILFIETFIDMDQFNRTFHKKFLDLFKQIVRSLHKKKNWIMKN